MNVPQIDAEAVALNGQLKIRLIASRDGHVIDIDELNAASATARDRYCKRTAPLFKCTPEELADILLPRCIEAMKMAQERPDVSPTPTRLGR